MARKSINPPLNIYKKIAFSFIVLTLILIGVIFYFTLSYAFITVFPKQENISTEINFVITDDVANAKPDEGIFQGKVVDQILEGEKSFSATGTKQLAGDLIGSVKIYSKLTKPQILIAKTRLLSADGVLFRLQDRVVVPAGGSIDTGVYADDPSKPLALAGAKFTVPGLSSNLQQFIYAEAIQDFTADGQTIKVVTQQDLDNAVTVYAEELAQQIVKDEDSSQAKVLFKEVITKDFSNKIDDQVDQFTVKLKLGVVGAIFDDQQIKNFAKSSLEGFVPSDKKLVATNSDKIVYEITNYDLDNKIVQIKSTISGVAVINENSPILDQDKLIKLSLSEIKSYLENFDSIERVEVNFFPAWIRKVPYFQDHIIIKIAE